MGDTQDRAITLLQRLASGPQPLDALAPEPSHQVRRALSLLSSSGLARYDRSERRWVLTTAGRAACARGDGRRVQLVEGAVDGVSPLLGEQHVPEAELAELREAAAQRDRLAAIHGELDEEIGDLERERSALLDKVADLEQERSALLDKVADLEQECASLRAAL